jgi:hypothetical protein
MTDDSNAKPVTVKVPIKLTPRAMQTEYHIGAGRMRPLKLQVLQAIRSLVLRGRGTSAFR